MATAAIPERISRTDYRHLVESLGLDFKCLRALRFSRDSIEAEVIARNAEGAFYMDDDEIAVHLISIPVED